MVAPGRPGSSPRGPGRCPESGAGPWHPCPPPPPDRGVPGPASWIRARRCSLGTQQGADQRRRAARVGAARDAVPGCAALPGRGRRGDPLLRRGPDADRTRIHRILEVPVIGYSDEGEAFGCRFRQVGRRVPFGSRPEIVHEVKPLTRCSWGCKFGPAWGRDGARLRHQRGQRVGLGPLVTEPAIRLRRRR